MYSLLIGLVFYAFASCRVKQSKVIKVVEGLSPALACWRGVAAFAANFSISPSRLAGSTPRLFYAFTPLLTRLTGQQRYHILAVRGE